MSEMAPEPNPVTSLNQNLTRLLTYHGELLDQAINDATDHLMPGGLAMVELAPIANLERWEAMTDASHHGRTYTFPDYEDDESEWPAGQRIEYWSEQIRRAYGAEYDKRPTFVTEVQFLKAMDNWAWENFTAPEWDAYTKDVRTAVAQLEAILLEGKRSQRGVQCLDCSIDLIRVSRDPKVIRFCEGQPVDDAGSHRFCDKHDRGGLADEWKCPDCGRSYDTESYYRAVHHAHFVHADYLPIEEAEARTGVAAGTIKVWVTRDKVRRHKAPGATRVTYCVADIEAANGEPEEVA